MGRGNHWNRFIYALWPPFYDVLAGARLLKKARGAAFGDLGLQAGERVCLVGVGTGADFDFLPDGITAVGVDLSGPMLARARRKLPRPGCEIRLQRAHAEDLPFPPGSFDAAVLTLIVSVASDGRACLREAARVVRPGGRLLVFDKFLAPGRRPSVIRRLLNLLTRLFGTDINRSFEDLAAGLPLRVVSDRPVLFRGAYRSIVLEREYAPGQG